MLSNDEIKQNSPFEEEIIEQEHYNNFWNKLSKNWDLIYEAFTQGSQSDVERANYLLNFFLGEKLQKYLEIESTVGELNRIAFDKAKNIIEIYISPKLKKENIPYMSNLLMGEIKLPNLNINRYRAFNIKDALIEDINFDNYKISYNDLGCQSSFGYTEDILYSTDNIPKKRVIINLVIYVKAEAAKHILEKKKLKVIMPDKSIQEIEKWLPNSSTAIDLFLINAVGEYNFIHNIGYIDFIPENDPLIEKGSVFTELADIRGKLALLDKSVNSKICHTCNRNDLQKKLFICSRCKKVRYCCRICQSIDYKTHKLFCNN